jgi:hypothetical protein
MVSVYAVTAPCVLQVIVFMLAPAQVMTLIDLPGITHYDVSGQDIHKQTSDMVSGPIFKILFFIIELTCMPSTNAVRHIGAQVHQE